MAWSGSLRLFLLIIAAALSAWACGTTGEGTARHAVTQLREAIVAHDPDRALTYVDVDQVVTTMVEKGFGRTKAASEEEAMGLIVGRHLASLMRPQLVEFVRQQLRMAITSSEETGYFSSIRKARVWLLDIAVEGDTAVVRARGDKKPAFRMARAKDGVWRIV